MARIDVLTERPIGLVDPGIFGSMACACPDGDLRAAVRDLGATSMRWVSRPDKPWCGEAEPVLCLDMATGTLDEALDWVEYCRGTYGVRYWGLGRDMHDGRAARRSTSRKHGDGPRRSAGSIPEIPACG